MNAELINIENSENNKLNVDDDTSNKKQENIIKSPKSILILY